MRYHDLVPPRFDEPLWNRPKPKPAGETVDEFIARGGKITVAKQNAGPESASWRDRYRLED